MKLVKKQDFYAIECVSYLHQELIIFEGNECLVLEFASKGSLDKIIHGDKVKLTLVQMLKFSRDIAAGKSFWMKKK